MNHSLNPTLARLLTLCRMNRSWTRGEGVWLFDEDGRRFLGCYAQYGAVALGHNAPCVRDAVHAALAACEPAMVQPYRARWAEQLANAHTRLAPGDLPCCVFATSGADAVEAASPVCWRSPTRSNHNDPGASPLARPRDGTVCAHRQVQLAHERGGDRRRVHGAVAAYHLLEQRPGLRVVDRADDT